MAEYSSMLFPRQLSSGTAIVKGALADGDERVIQRQGDVLGKRRARAKRWASKEDVSPVGMTLDFLLH